MYPTRRQKAVLDAIRQHITDTGQSPTLQELADRCQLSSLATVHRHLALLQERGLLRRRKSRRRGIELTPATRSAFAELVPLLGSIAAGQPIEAISDRQEIAIPCDLLGRRKNYVLRVKGDSMRDEQIYDGDFVVVEERQHASEGEVVVALIEGRDATLKTLRRGRGRVRLQPANPSVAPIFVRPEDLRIQGVVTGLIRKYS